MQTFLQYVEACHYSTPSCSYSFIKCWLCAFKGQKKTPLPLFLLVSCHHVRQKSFFLVLSGSGKMTFAAQSGAYNLQHHRPSSGRRLTVPNVTRRVLPISTDDLDGLQQVNPPPRMQITCRPPKLSAMIGQRTRRASLSSFPPLNSTLYSFNMPSCGFVWNKTTKDREMTHRFMSTAQCFIGIRPGRSSLAVALHFGTE